MKFEIEIKEENWKQLDSNSDVQILYSDEPNPKLKVQTVANILTAKFPVASLGDGTFETADKNGYFYGYGYVPFIEERHVVKFIFRTKTLFMYQIITMYSKRIDSLDSKLKAV